MSKAHKAFSRAVLTALRQLFEQRGWRRGRQTESSLHLDREPDPEVRQSLGINQPYPDELLPGGALGLTCWANVAFVPLEDVINSALGRDPKTFGRLSASLSLGSLVPNGSYLLDNAYVADIGTDPNEAALGLVRDYETYLAPLLNQLASTKILADESYLPPHVNVWSWNIRRAVYFCRLGERNLASKFLDRIDEETTQSLADLGPMDSEERSKLFTSGASLLRNSRRRSAQQAQEAARALRKLTEGFFQ